MSCCLVAGSTNSDSQGILEAACEIRRGGYASCHLGERTEKVQERNIEHVQAKKFQGYRNGRKRQSKRGKLTVFHL